MPSTSPQLPDPSTPPAPSGAPALAQRLRGLAWCVRGLVLLGGLGIAALPLWLLLAPASSLQPVQAIYGVDLAALVRNELTAAARWRLAGVTLLPVSLALLALWQLWALFGDYRHGDVFGNRPVRNLRRFGWAMVALAVAEPLSRPLASVALTLDHGPGHRMLVVTLGTHDYALLLCALVFVAIARVMSEAARLAEENQGFV